MVKVCREFLEGKFKTTDAETKRDEFTDLGPQIIADPLTEEAFVRTLWKLKKDKTCGPDAIQSEVWLNCGATVRCTGTVSAPWDNLSQEYVSPELVRASFVMLYKNKKAVWMTRPSITVWPCYHMHIRCSLIMLEWIQNECTDFLSDWQAGFRSERGCRDNVMLLRVLFDHVMITGEKLYVTYIDYSTAFDTVSHKWLDLRLRKAGASRKTHVTFRAIYAAAEDTSWLRGLNGEHIYNARFKVRRGVVQGDIVFPIFFIPVMEIICHTHDKNPTGVTLGSFLQVGTLTYAVTSP